MVFGGHFKAQPGSLALPRASQNLRGIGRDCALCSWLVLVSNLPPPTASVSSHTMSLCFRDSLCSPLPGQAGSLRLTA
jgi:hypothetical protein